MLIRFGLPRTLPAHGTRPAHMSRARTDMVLFIHRTVRLIILRVVDLHEIRFLVFY